MCPGHPFSAVRGGACGLAWVGAGTSPDGLSLLKNAPPSGSRRACLRTNAGGLSEPQGHLAPPLGADEAIERRGFIDGAGLCLAVLDVRLAGRRWAADPGGESSRSHQSLVDSGSLTWEVSAVSSCRQAHQERPRTPRVLTSTSRGLSKFEFGDRYPSVPAEGSPTSPAVPGTQQTEVLSALSLCGPLPHCFLLCQMGVASSGLSGGAVPEGGKALLFTFSLEGLQVGPRGLQALQGSLPGAGTGGRVSAGVFVLGEQASPGPPELSLGQRSRCCPDGCVHFRHGRDGEASLGNGRAAGGLGDRLWLSTCGSSQESGPKVQGHWALLRS